MNIEQQVISLELARKLKELGIRQDSLFDWVLSKGHENFYLYLMSPYTRKNLNGYIEQYSAFTVAELGEMLPIYSRDCNQLCIHKFPLGWSVKYCCAREIDKEFCEKNLVNAMGEMLAYLIENDYLKAEDINK